MRSLLLTLAVAAGAPQHLGWPTGLVHHAYFDTPRGQLHYVSRGLDSQTAPIVYLHSHPRSSAEFQYVLQELDAKQPVIAVDWFGMGFSEDYNGDSADDFCDYEEFSGYVLDLLADMGVEKFIPVGALKGAHPAMELARQGGAERVGKVGAFGMLILNPDQQAYVQNVLVPAQKEPSLLSNGSHLLQFWADPSAAVAEFPEELLWNQDKTTDALRGLLTGWQMQAAWAAYNPKLPSTLAEVDAFAETLLVHPLQAYASWTTYGLDPTFSLEQMDKALVHDHNTSVFVEASEGMLHQNATYLGQLLQSFLKGPSAIEV